MNEEFEPDVHGLHMTVGTVMYSHPSGWCQVRVEDEDGSEDILDDVGSIGSLVPGDQCLVFTSDLRTWAVQGGAPAHPGGNSTPGPQGPAGPPGPAGPQGHPGPQGPKGDTGARGPVGVKGDKGDVGPSGPAGPQGVQGSVGPAGPAGAQGPQGEKGATGPQGVQGPAGPAGAQGVPGPQGAAGATGPAGAQGPKGDQGDSLKIDKWTPLRAWTETDMIGALPLRPLTVPEIHVVVYKGADGTTYNLILSHNPGDTKVSSIPGREVGEVAAVPMPPGWTYAGVLKGVKGDKGDQGIQGVAGAKGDQGIQGVKGDVGPAGPAGAQGPAGAKGDQGIPGVKGDVGPAGPAGVQGPAGGQGPKGDKGDKGDTGEGMPVGAIIAYGGGTPPPGWHLCDGTAHNSTALKSVLGSDNTPDLRGKFVRAAGPSVPHTGGHETVALDPTNMPRHKHDVSVTLTGQPDHGHHMDFTSQSGTTIYTAIHTYGTVQGGGNRNINGVENNTPQGHDHRIVGDTWGGGGHNHPVTVREAEKGSGVAFSVLPPFYALTYIIKT